MNFLVQSSWGFINRKYYEYFLYHLSIGCVAVLILFYHFNWQSAQFNWIQCQRMTIIIVVTITFVVKYFRLSKCVWNLRKFLSSMTWIHVNALYLLMTYAHDKVRVEVATFLHDVYLCARADNFTILNWITTFRMLNPGLLCCDFCLGSIID